MAVTIGIDVYVSVADADTYWSNRNNSNWSAADTADKEKALREATQYIDGAYTFIGYLADLDQKLAWPRSYATIFRGNFKGAYYDQDEIPDKVKDACCELALEGLNARLRPVQERGGAIKKEKVDVIEVEYMDWSPSQKSFDFVSLLLKDLTVHGGNQARIIR